MHFQSRTMPLKRRRARQRTLAIDVGGSTVKCALLDARGRMVSERISENTPERFTPAQLLALIGRLAKQMPSYDRVAVGIPGIVHRDVVYALPASRSRAFKRFELGARLAHLLGAPVRVTNDAAMHGLAAIRGEGVEMVITLGTGLGTALFIDGGLSAHYQTLPEQDEPFSAFGKAALEEDRPVSVAEARVRAVRSTARHHQLRPPVRRRRQRRAAARRDAVAREAHPQRRRHPWRLSTLGMGRRALTHADSNSRHRLRRHHRPRRQSGCPTRSPRSDGCATRAAS